MHAGGESDGCVVPSKCPNNGGQPPAEGTEGRQPTKENTGQATVPRTQSRISELSDLLGVRKAAGKDKRTRFTALLHHVTVSLLQDSYSLANPDNRAMAGLSMGGAHTIQNGLTIRNCFITSASSRSAAAANNTRRPTMRR